MAGYREFADATPRSVPAEASEQSSPDEKFRILLPSGAGAPPSFKPYGPYHINHYIAYFKIEGEELISTDESSVAGVLTHRFFKHFCKIFSSDNIAQAQLGRPGYDRHKSMPTVEFKLGGNRGNAVQLSIGFTHPDWVAMQRYGLMLPDENAEVDTDYLTNGLMSFCGNTLHRNWYTPFESILATKSKTDMMTLIPKILANPASLNPIILIPEIVDDLGIHYALEVNKHHFLAGSRSWSVKYDLDAEMYLVETAAIERNSLYEFSKLEALAGSRDDIDELWVRLLLNFLRSTDITHNRIIPVKPPTALQENYGYEPSKIDKLVLRNSWSFKLASDIPDDDGVIARPIRSILRRHEGLRVHVQTLSEN